MRKGTVKADNFLSFFSLPSLVFNICTGKRLFGPLRKSIALFDIRFLKFGTSCRKGIGKKWSKSWQSTKTDDWKPSTLSIKAIFGQNCQGAASRYNASGVSSPSFVPSCEFDAYARGSLIHCAEVYCSLRHCNCCHRLWMATSQLRHLYCNSFTWECCDLCWDRLPGEKATTQLLLPERPYIRWS